jgi:N-acetylglutamate synthase-like GNAT family acetyltransferase
MAIRKHRAGELVVEQTRDLERVCAMLARAGMGTDGIEWPAACYIVAYVGDEAVGVIGVESKIDAALLRSLYVDESMRGRGIGAALVAAARKAAHTRGARHLYLFTKDAAGFFPHLGFEPADTASVMSTLAGAPQVEYYRAHPEELRSEAAYHLDISSDGVIER